MIVTLSSGLPGSQEHLTYFWIAPKGGINIVFRGLNLNPSNNLKYGQ